MPFKPNAVFTPANMTMLNLLEGGVPVEQGGEIIKDIMANSLMMQLAVYEDMDAPEKEFDMLVEGLSAYWVGEGQRIRTSKAKWAKVKMVAKKLGVIVPVTREYLKYKQPDFFDKMKPLISEAFWKKFDAATFLNVDNPFNWSVDESATDRFVEGDLNIANFEAMISHLNDEGFEPNALVSKVANNSLLKNLIRDEDGLKTRLYDAGEKTLDGVPVFNLHRDLTEFAKGSLYAGDFNYARYGIPYNMNYQISTEATLTTIKGDDDEVVNLFERESAAMRVTMDVAFMIVSDEAFAGLKAPASP